MPVLLKTSKKTIKGGNTMNEKALFVGNSDGIGLATTRELLKKGWRVNGISRGGC
jgi:NAD(P)-dependent dehydrogenase (short-subunit alcohol dehydrogenase family)